MGLGLLSRRLPAPKELGDILYATMCFWLAGALWPTAPPLRNGAAAFAFCCCIELAKLIPSETLAALRHTAAGHLVLGTGFRASNLLCYLGGAAVPALLWQKSRAQPERGQ